MRKALLTIPVLLLLACSSTLEEGAMSLTPAAPEGGETLRVRFHPERSTSALDRSEELLLRFTLIAGDGSLHSEALPMERRGSSWEARLTAADLIEDPAVMVFAFVDGEDPKIFDNNQGRSWRVLFQQDGRDAPGANLQTYRLLGGEERLAEVLAFPRDRDGAGEYLERELRLHPENFRARRAGWLRDLDALGGAPPDSLADHIALELGKRLAGWQDWETLPPETVDLLDLYWRIGRREEMQNLQSAMIDRFPEAEAAAEILHYNATREMNMDVRIEKLEELHARYPDWKDIEQDRGYLIYWSLGQGGDPDKAREVADSGGTIEPGFASYLAQRFVAMGENERATALLEQSLQRYAEDEWTPEGRLSRREWERDRDEGIASTLYALAELRIREGVSRDALPHLERILEEFPEHADAEVLRALLGIQLRMERVDAALATYERLAAVAELSSDELETWREHYDGEQPFLSHLAELRSAAREEAWAEYDRHALHWPAPPATFTDMAGAEVSLDSLRGQVLLVDFWASWCGPCKMALPGLDAMAPELAASGDFRVIPANTWERVSGEERRELAQRTWDELGLSLPIYFDRDREEGRPAVEAFGVSGIPTSFVIGKDGKILFKTIGYGGEAGERELRRKIEWAMSR